MNYLVNVKLGFTELQNYAKHHNDFLATSFHLFMQMF